MIKGLLRTLSELRILSELRALSEKQEEFVWVAGKIGNLPQAV